MKPPYEITSDILEAIVSISEKLGEINASHLDRPSPELRRKNRIKTIQSSLEIEGNTLSHNQVTALFDNKRVLGPINDIIEVKNAIAAYEMISSYDLFSIKSFRMAHEILMKGLIKHPGRFRNKPAGIVKDKSITHIAPPGDMVNPLIKDLFTYLHKDKDVDVLKSCVFHYEMEFIHPFTDGNGRMGRLWQTVILCNKYPVFEFIPIETIIKEKQNEYYKSLSFSDKIGKSTPFIEFMLDIIELELDHILSDQRVNLTQDDRLKKGKEIFGAKEFSRKDYCRYFKFISLATASRDLKRGIEQNILTKKGDKRLTKYRYPD